MLGSVMCDQIKKIEEYRQEYIERLRLIREGSEESMTRAEDLRKEMEEYICENTPENLLKNKTEINIKI